MDGIGSSSGGQGPRRTPQVRKELLAQLPESTRVALPKLGADKIIALRRYFGKMLGDIAHLREGPAFPRQSFVNKEAHSELYYQALKDVQTEERQWNWRTTPKVPCEAPEPVYPDQIRWRRDVSQARGARRSRSSRSNTVAEGCIPSPRSLRSRSFRSNTVAEACTPTNPATPRIRCSRSNTAVGA